MHLFVIRNISIDRAWSAESNDVICSCKDANLPLENQVFKQNLYIFAGNDVIGKE